MELAKKFDDPKARAFINGVLNAVKTELEENGGVIPVVETATVEAPEAAEEPIPVEEPDADPAVQAEAAETTADAE